MKLYTKEKKAVLKKTSTLRVVMGVTTVQTNQRAGYRSRGTNGPISVQQEVM